MALLEMNDLDELDQVFRRILTANTWAELLASTLGR